MTRLNRLAVLCCVSGLSLALTGCPGPAPTPEPDGSVVTKKDAGVCTPTPCGDKECGDDGCGTACGVCGSGTSCNEATWKCEACTAETHADFCSRVAKTGKVCGSITDKDTCTQNTRTEDCGGCTGGKTCAADNTCTGSCSYEGDTQFCLNQGKNCGSVTANDTCGTQQTVNCGTCATGDCVNNVCTGGVGCGNGTLDTGEACDGTNLNAKTCVTEGFASGTLTCNANCTLNLSACVAGADCGNGAINGTEQCDGTNLNSKTCLTQGFGGGTLTCNANCTFNTSACTAPKPCGNGALDVGEDCDGTNLNGKTCVTQGFGGGTLTCSPTCTFVVDACTAGANCGNGNIDANEACDGTNLNSKTCQTEGFGGGTLACKANCTLDTAGCTGGATPANDKCAGAIDITTATMPVSGTTKAATNDSAGSCEGDYYYYEPQHDGADVVYKFTTAAPKNAEVRIDRGSGSTYNPVVYIRADCAASADKACSGTVSGSATATAKNLPAGTYYIIVDGEDLSQGDFQLTLTLTDPPPAPTNDTCTTPETIALDSSTGHGATTGDSTNAIGDTKGSCESTSGTGGDMVYVVDTTGLGERNITASVTFTDTTASASATVYIRKVCDSVDAADELSCDHPMNETATAVAKHMPEGKYYIWVDSYTGDEGAFALAVDAVVPPLPAGNDSCATTPGPEAIALDSVTGHGEVTGDTSTATDDDARGSCASSYVTTGNDLVYSIDTTSLGDRLVTFTLTFADTASYGHLFVRKVCDSTVATDEVACKYPYDDVATVQANLVAGKYFVWVDSRSGDEGTFTLTIDAVKPLCDSTGVGSTPLALDTNGHGTVSGSTATGTADFATGSCRSTSGKDAVYEIDTTGMGDRTLKATATFTDTSAYATVYIRKVCNSDVEADEVACDNPYDNIAAAVAKNQPPGKYYVWVDSASGDEGDFTLVVDAVVPPPVPTNETCDSAGVGAAEITLDTNGHGTATSDTSLATAGDTKGTCEYTSGKDVVYMIDTSSLGERNVTAKVTFEDTGASATIYIRKVCDSTAAGDELGCDHPYDNTATAVAKHLPAGKYYIWVDSFDGDEGVFDLTVDAVEPPPAPTNDACGSEKDLGDISTAPVTDTGSIDAADDSTAPTTSCASSDSADVVYKFTTGATIKPVRVTVVPDAALKPLVYVRTGCADTASAAEIVCDYNYTAGDTLSQMFTPTAAATTYYLWIDGYSGTLGGYTLTVEELTPPANDVCANPVTLTLGAAAVPGDTTLANPDYGVALSTACYTDMGSYNAKGNDLVYVYSPTVAGDFTVEVVPDDWDACIWYTEAACGGDGSTCVHAVDKGMTGGTESLKITGQVGTTYYIYVDRYSDYSAGGPFTIQVK